MTSWIMCGTIFFFNKTEVTTAFELMKLRRAFLFARFSFVFTIRSLFWFKHLLVAGSGIKLCAYSWAVVNSKRIRN